MYGVFVGEFCGVEEIGGCCGFGVGEFVVVIGDDYWIDIGVDEVIGDCVFDEIVGCGGVIGGG